jgi:hypothetical protein
MVPADMVFSNIILHFCLLKKRLCNKIWSSGEGTDISWSNLWGADQLWVVLLKIYWTWNNLSKNALILHKKIHPLFHLVHPKYPYIVLKYPSKKWGIQDVTVGVFTLMVPIHRAGTCGKKSILME